MKLRNLRQLALLSAAFGLLTLPACQITKVKTTYGPTKPMSGVAFHTQQQQLEATPEMPAVAPAMPDSAAQYAAAPPPEAAPVENQYPIQLTSGEEPANVPPPEHYYQTVAPIAQAPMPCPAGPCGPGYGGNCGPGGYGCYPVTSYDTTPPCWPEDEYIYDGGDRNQQTMIGADFSMRGLDIEDTVAHYDTLDGQRIVTPSNRVCVYAPRFAAVRKIYGLSAGLKNEGLIANRADLELQGQNNNGIPSNLNQPLQPQRNLGARTATIFRDRNMGVGLENRQILIQFVKEFQAYEDFSIMKVGIYDASQKARLATSIQNAIAWTENQAVQVTIEGQMAHEGTYELNPQEAVMFDLHGKPCLRIVKAASNADAQPGDIVDFTLRFDNLGDQRIGNVTIIDNLSPRLELVEGSAQCSIDAEFLTQPNEKGSQILRWEIKDTLEVGQGGVCRFKCRVR